MHKVKTLIDKAVLVCGTHAALAHELGLHASYLSGMRNGVRHIAPDVAILIADIGRQNVEDAALAAIIENGHDTVRGRRVEEILGRYFLAKLMK